MSQTTIVEHLRGSNPFAPDYLTAEIGRISCGFRDGSWSASSSVDWAPIEAYKDIRYEMEMAMDGLQIAFPTHDAMRATSRNTPMKYANPMRIRYTICGLPANTPIIVLFCVPIQTWCSA